MTMIVPMTAERETKRVDDDVVETLFWYAISVLKMLLVMLLGNVLLSSIKATKEEEERKVRETVKDVVKMIETTDVKTNELYGMYSMERNEMMKMMKEQEERIVFLEQVPFYLEVVKHGYRKETHIPADDIVKCLKYGLDVFDADPHLFNRYLNDGWNCWVVQASEEELREVCFVTARMPFKSFGGRRLNYIRFHDAVTICGGIKEGYQDNYHSYHKKVNSLRKCRDCHFVNPPVGFDKIFAKKVYERWENVLNALYDEKLLN
jgi:hypothetical protein